MTTNSDKPRALVLNGSPKKRGHNARLLAAAAKGLEGFNISRLDIGDLEIQPCRGCNSCLKKKVLCQDDDDMAVVIDHFDQADILLFASPVYFYGHPAQTKALIDRCHPLWHDSTWKKRAKRPAYFFSTCETDGKNEFTAIQAVTTLFFNTIGFTLENNVFVSRLKQDANAQFAKGLVDAEKLGKTINQLGKSPLHVH